MFGQYASGMSLEFEREAILKLLRSLTKGIGEAGAATAIARTAEMRRRCEAMEKATVISCFQGKMFEEIGANSFRPRSMKYGVEASPWYSC